jgi:Leucine-rich repeat (LRR) protein
LSKLATLEVLSISRNQIKRIINTSFAGLLNLRYLDLSFNPLDHMDNDSFQYSENLNGLVLNRLGLKSIKFLSSLKNINKLGSLDISNNKIMHIDTSLIKVLSLNSLKITNISLNDNYVFDYLNGERLEVFHAAINNFSILPGHKDKMTRLVELNLSSLNIENCKAVGIDKMKNLQILDLSYNQISDLNKTLCNDDLKTHALTHLNLRNNKFRTVDINEFGCLSKLKHLDLSNNVLGELSSNLNLKSFKNLKEFIGTHINISDFPMFSIENNLLEYLFLNKNMLKSISDNNFYSLYNLFFLDLSFNEISEIKIKYDQGLFNRLYKLEYLDLSHNKFNSDHLVQINFLDLPNLLALNISHNKIDFISKDFIYQLNKLFILILSFNPIFSIQTNSIHMLAKLETLSLEFSHNSTLLELNFVHQASVLKNVYFYSKNEIINNFHSLTNSLGQKVSIRVVKDVKYFKSIIIILKKYYIRTIDDCILVLKLLKNHLFLNLRNDADLNNYLFKCKRFVYFNEM